MRKYIYVVWANLCCLFKVIGNKVPGVGDRPCVLLGRLEQLGSQLGDTLES